MKHEIVCIKRYGFSHLATEGANFEAKVTYHGWVSGGCNVKVHSEWLVPPAVGNWETQ